MARDVKAGGPTLMNMPGLMLGEGSPNCKSLRIYCTYMRNATSMPSPCAVRPPTMTDMACVGDMDLAPELDIVPHNMNGKIGRI